MVTSLDFAPTILGFAGLETRIPVSMRGADRSPVLRGEAEPSVDPAATYYRAPSASDPADVRGLRTRTRKLIASWEPDDNLVLSGFDLSADPFELCDEPDTPAMRELAHRLLARLDAENDPWPGTGPLRAHVGG